MPRRKLTALGPALIATLVVLLALLTTPLLGQKTVHVKGYVKKDGTVVEPYDRPAPGTATPAPRTTPSAPGAPAPTPAKPPPGRTPPPIARVVSAGDDPVATVTATAPIYLLPDANRSPLRTATVNTILRVLEGKGEWFKVEFQDPQYGPRQGYVLATNVRLQIAALYEPMDLSVAPERPPVERAAVPLAAPARPTATRAPVPSRAVAAVVDTVYVTKTGTEYHAAGCRHLARSMIPMNRADAARLYGACSVCRP
jgi:hypothetical protein